MAPLGDRDFACGSCSFIQFLANGSRGITFLTYRGLYKNQICCDKHVDIYSLEYDIVDRHKKKTNNIQQYLLKVTRHFRNVTNI